MDNANPLDQLPPLALPEAVSWWPLAPLWWLLIALTLLGIIYVLQKVHHHNTTSQIKRTAQKELQQLYAHYLKTHDVQHYLLQCNALLRRFVQQQYPNYYLTQLSHHAWLEQLDLLVGRPYLNSTTGLLLISIYQKPSPTANIGQLNQLLTQWLNAINVQSRQPLALVRDNLSEVDA